MPESCFVPGSQQRQVVNVSESEPSEGVKGDSFVADKTYPGQS